MKTLKTEPENHVMVEEMDEGAVEALLDREARKLLGISGAEFAKKWAAGDYMDADDPRITDFAILLP